MGVSKSMMEKAIVAKSRIQKNEICVTRYGNVIFLRGSVILFVNQITSNKNVTVTDKNMTRFMMTMEDAIDLVLFAFLNGKNGEILVKSLQSTIETILNALSKILKKTENKVNWFKAWRKTS